ncbi:MAG: RNA 2',3'-cyclic phosphodiesterase [Erythrobacter sp.]|nr:RNA 2',3'-cyclic phosphodiesterase [Erythrobacter sp.]
MQRLFVALSPPVAIGDALLDLQEGVAGARWSDADNLHLTLRFVGEVGPHTLRDLATALADVRFDPFALTLAGVGHFAGKGRSTAIWAGVQPSAELDLLQMRVEMACRRAGLPPETRRFAPHVTLAWLNSGSAQIGGWLARHGTLRLPAWPVAHMALYESDLTPNGPVYSELCRFPATAA